MDVQRDVTQCSSWKLIDVTQLLRDVTRLLMDVTIVNGRDLVQSIKNGLVNGLGNRPAFKRRDHCKGT